MRGMQASTMPALNNSWQRDDAPRTEVNWNAHTTCVCLVPPVYCFLSRRLFPSRPLIGSE